MNHWSGGKLLHIHIARAASYEMEELDEAEFVAGRGIVGDRYFLGNGTYSRKPDVREVTLIESEAIEAANRDYKASVEPAATRRNVLTSGVALNHLVGRDFRVGHVVFRGIRLCEPCGHLAKLTSTEAERGLVHRGGLRAQIVTAGTIHVGDEIEEMPKALANAG